MIRAAHLRAGYRVLARHLRYAGADPRKLYWVARRAVHLARDGSIAGVLERHVTEDVDYADYAEWCAQYEPPPATFNARLAALAARPRISILLPVRDPPLPFLQATIASVQAQCYPDWELCIVDDASTDRAVSALVDAAAVADARIRVIRRPHNGGIAVATNDALSIASGAFCAFLDHDDTLAPDALLTVAEAAQRAQDTAMLFSDEDKLDAAGARTRPFFKPAWDDEWLRTTNCVLHFLVVRTDVLREHGGIALGIDGAQDWDLVLRVARTVGRARIGHIPRVLYHWRELPGSTAAAAFEKPGLVDAQRRVLAGSIAQRGDAASISSGTSGWRITYPLPAPPPMVSIVIPTRDRHLLLRACIESIYVQTDYPTFEIVIVDNDSRDPDACAYLEALSAAGRARVIAYPHTFNYAAQCNLGAQAARGTMLALVNNDIEATSGGWLRELVSLAIRPQTGLAGATLYYPDGTLQHAGVVLGLNGVGDRPWIGTRRGFGGPYGRAHAVREVSAMITACAVVVRDRYLAAGGMDETLAVSCNDLDLCLRLSRAGFHHVVSPHAELVHHESASRGYADDPVKAQQSGDEETRFASRWAAALRNDPLYNPNLTLRGKAYGLAHPPRHPQA